MKPIDHIRSIGKSADSIFDSLGIRLTQGGEPTFVPAAHEAPEWNTAALGPDKLRAGRLLARCLVEKAFPGALVMQTAGKHYPGEPLPRWSLGIYYFRDGRMLWNGINRFKLDPTARENPTPETPFLLVRQLAKNLGLDEGFAQDGFEDVEGQMRLAQSKGEEVPLPVFHRGKQSFLSPDFESSATKERWAAMCRPTAAVLPLDFEAGKWRSARWTFAHTDEITLLTGDSSPGLRLPLDKLRGDTVRTALTSHVNGDGELCVFLPPVKNLAASLSLIRALNDTVASLNLPPIIVEGYAPPSSAEMDKVTIIPDPGVLEINLPPAATWDDFERFGKLLFHCAEEAGLQPFKYQFSGRRVSTGGGSHIILGGPSLDDNPFLKLPRLLPSFLRFFQNHPSLSFVFTGLFVGPSCQAPRVDESFHDLLYELEISLRAIESMGSPADPAKIDLILRNLLLDWNGNTHRAEISVDKFHNANMPNGRLGLVEFRAFEMMPSYELFLASHALLRALAAAFAKRPYTGELIDFAEKLHDQFSLPYFLQRDLREVVAYLGGEGFDIPADLFDPILDFRFPVIHRAEFSDAEAVIRQAIEPWPVLGEQPTAAGTVARSVDASTDRLEILVRAQNALKFPTLSVNGCRAPLVVQSDHEAVCAVRYRLFDLVQSLQPHVKAHSPLSFEWIDRGTGLVTHAFDYLNWKPKSGGYDGLPRNEQEARQRVSERLIDRPEKVGKPSQPRAFHNHSRAPYTLDLRAVPPSK
ncbi:transglutaminase family protein [Oscillatoria amoena NRMC-F 0135]|nr:transglutaminase family protein [Oscillatoria laete-virens]MDL5048017.1 transglutaminase family protein [Oscillatoria amoena NRMC-F 0135]MDL5052500.1 transglutaminase family protein [Oscillatoria laete-virens NRMC-F 0139]